MYIGKRDAHMSINVPNELCFEVEYASGTWIEVMVPDREQRIPSLWESFIVKPEQVCFLDSNTNVIENINAHTAIKCGKHFEDKNGKRKIIPGTERMLDPYEIRQRIDFYVYMQSYKGG